MPREVSFAERKPAREVLQLGAADARVVPWKNGRGTTTELALWPPDARFEHGEFDWRLSLAPVDEPGPFSSFPGVERILTVTQGAGLVLVHGADAPRARLRRLEPYRFSGDWSTSAELPYGPITDFNVLFRPERVRAEVQALALGARRTRETLRTPHAFLHVLAGKLVARATGEEEPFELAAGASLWLRGLAGGEELALEGRTKECELVIVGVASAGG
ncbi:MAG: HutD family protein [Planctomycetes bacterium]|nr:HutD family protein [Planctomycetota bacterium]